MPRGDQKLSPIMYCPEKPRAKQPVGDFMMPMAFHQLNKFKQLNRVLVKLFQHSNKKLILFSISNSQNFEFNLDIFLISDGSRHHYVLITNIKRLIHKYIQKKQRLDNHLCRFFFILALQSNDMRDMKKNAKSRTAKS